MNRSRTRTSSRNSLLRSPLVLSLVAVFAFLSTTVLAQVATPEPPPVNGFRIGERLTYGVSIGRFPGAAYAELYTVSRGRLGDKDAIELRSKFKALELASAAFYLIDETRTTFVSPSTALPLHTSITSNAFGLPRETSQSFAAAPTPHADLVSIIYKIRHMGGSGSLTMQENDKVYSVTFLTGAIEKHKTDAGEFDTTLVTLQSEYFTEHGLTNVRINLSNDEARIPVLLRFKTSKGAFRAGLASVQMIETEAPVQVVPTPVRTPAPDRTPKPAAT